MAKVKCDISDCAYFNNDRCKKSSIGIYKDSFYESNDTVCGSFKNKKGAGFMTEFATEFMNFKDTRVKCTAEGCRHNSNLKCGIDTLTVSGLSNSVIVGSETFCASFDV